MNQLLFSILICFLAGAGAGLGTGFAGLSAATVISPMLIAFLDVPAYDAIGIALASDVLASAVSARTYAKNGSIDIKNGLAMIPGGHKKVISFRRNGMASVMPFPVSSARPRE